MWYEHGQSDKLINLNMVRSIQITTTRDALKIIYHNGQVAMLPFEDEAETTEAYQVIRANLMMRV